MKAELEQVNNAPLQVSGEHGFWDKKKSEMTPQEQQNLQIIRTRKANIDMLKECIDHINETWVITEEEKESKIETIQKEIDDLYEAVFRTYGMFPDELDNLELRKNIDPKIIESYYERLRKKNIKPSDNESKVLNENSTIVKNNNKLVKKLNLESKNLPNTSPENKKGSTLKERLGLKML